MTGATRPIRGRLPLARLASAVLASGATLTLLAGCVTKVVTSSGAILPPPPGSSAPPVGTGSQTSVVVAPLCSVPYDGFTLPVVSPDGRYLATQTGVPPEWQTLLGGMGARRPTASGIEVWDLTTRDGKRAAQLNRGLILSGSADAAGVLVEEQLTDGSRRIGRVRWPGQSEENADGSKTMLDEVTPEWLVDDGRVNAFASLGPDGSLVWCVRDLEQPLFRLAIRRQGTAFEIEAMDEWSWMLPAFAEGGRSVFALRTRDGVTEMAYADASSEDAFLQSMVTKSLSYRCDARRAWQALAPLGSSGAVGPGDDGRLLLFHPDLRRMAVWNPADDSLKPLDEDSFAASIGADGTILVSDPDGVLVRSPNITRGKPPRIYDRMAVPRRVEGAPGTWIVLSPDRRTIRVVRLTLLGPPLAG